jgi:hypothetical protein
MTNLDHATFSNGHNLRSDSERFFVRESFSKFDHRFNMSFFDYKIWVKKWKQNVHEFSSCVPRMLKSPIAVFVASIPRNYDSAKCVFNPIHKFFIGIYNLNSWKVIKKFFPIYFLDIYSSFPIDYSSKISKLFFSPHDESPFMKIGYQIVNILYTVNDLTNGLRKEMRKSEHMTKACEGGSKNPFRLIYQVTKVTDSTNDLWLQNLRSTGI